MYWLKIGLLLVISENFLSTTPSAIPTLTYLWLRCLLTQLIYAKIKSPQKGLLLLGKVWNMPVLFSICFYQIYIGMTIDCVSITKSLLNWVKWMTDSYNKTLTQKVNVSGKISLCHKKNSDIFLYKNDCEKPYIDIYIDLLSINFNLLSIL